VSSNLAHGEVYSKQRVIKFVGDLRQVGGFLLVLQFPQPMKPDITEILLKVALNIITLTPKTMWLLGTYWFQLETYDSIKGPDGSMS
jgi:hypothetical protein